MPEPEHISDAQVEALLDADTAVRSCDAAFRLYGEGVMTSPPRDEDVTRDGDDEVFRLRLPADWPPRWRGQKVIVERSGPAAGRLGDRQAHIELEDRTRERSVTFDAEAITNLRTGAAAALGLRYLGAEAPHRIAIIGTGRIAIAAARCVDALFEPERITATSRTRERRDAFRDAVQPHVSARVEVAAGLHGCLRDADAVITTVPAAEPVLSAEDLVDDVPLSVVAGDPRTQQLHLDLLCRRPLLVDHAEQARRSGDLLAAREAGRLDDVDFLRRADGEIADFGDAACGRLHLPSAPTGIAYLTGMAVQDLHAVVTVLERRDAGSA